MTVSNPTIEKLIPNSVDLYTEALEDNFRHYKVNMLTNNSARYTGSREDLSAYAEEQLEAIRNGTDKLMKFEAVAGKKYYKIVQCEWSDTHKEYRQRSVNSFVDKKTGEVYKASSWKAPAKGVRFDMRIMSHRAMMHDYKQVDWAGGHLYYR